MNLAAMSKSPVGHLAPISGMDPWRGELYEHQAFVPAPLPTSLSELRLSDGAWSSVVAATGALAKLDQAGRQVPNPELVRRPTLRRDAQSKSEL